MFFFVSTFRTGRVSRVDRALAPKWMSFWATRTCIINPRLSPVDVMCKQARAFLIFSPFPQRFSTANSRLNVSLWITHRSHYSICKVHSRFMPQSETPPIHVPSPGYLVPISRGPGIDSWPDHVNQLCRSRPAELPSHCSRFFTIADVASLSSYSTFRFKKFEGVGTVSHTADCEVPTLNTPASQPHSLTFHFEYLSRLLHTEIIHALHSQIQAF